MLPPWTIDDVQVRTRMANQACQKILMDQDRQEGGEQIADNMPKTELLRTANQILTELQVDSDRKFRFLRVERLAHGGYLWEMDSSEAAKWMKEGDNFRQFATQLRPGAQVRMQKKLYEVLMLNLKISFRIKQDLHVLEEVNSMPEGAIIAARWVKPINRRDKEQ